ncbi:MAG: hypothetical protein COY19_03875, partial [Candidatus Marinimicrobia bacterium CG_4_10_14_0_2_um_filter_48_9]
EGETPPDPEDEFGQTPAEETPGSDMMAGDSTQTDDTATMPSAGMPGGLGGTPDGDEAAEEEDGGMFGD